jgi:hypothetical protein
MPRSPKLTPEFTEAICRLIRDAGMAPSTAAARLMTNPQMVSEWLQQGEARHPTKKPNPQTKAFALAVRAAQAADVENRVGRITESARGGQVRIRKTITKPDGTVIQEEAIAPPDWKADAWLLERTHRDTYGRNTPGEDTTQQPRVVVVLPDNGRGPGRREILPGDVQRNGPRRRKVLDSAVLSIEPEPPEPAGPIDTEGNGHETPVSPPRVPSIHDKPDLPANHCPECRHHWRKHRPAGAVSVCCGGACPCTRARE